jgi:hypothetical protein
MCSEISAHCRSVELPIEKTHIIIVQLEVGNNWPGTTHAHVLVLNLIHVEFVGNELDAS